MDIYTQPYLKWPINKDLLWSAGTLLNVTWQPGGEERGGEGSSGENGRTDVWLRLLAVHLKLSQHC